MKNWLEQRIPTTDWQTEMFTAEDIVNFHNDFTKGKELKEFNSIIEIARFNLQTSQKYLGLAFISMIISIIAAIFVHWYICILPTLTTLIVWRNVVDRRELLNKSKNNLLKFMSKRRK